MKHKKLYLLVAVPLLFVSCMRDYEYDIDVQPHIVINSFLSPDSTIRIDLWASKKLDGNEDFTPLTGAQVTLSEDDAVILDTRADAPVTFSYYPKPGLTYSIVVRADGYPQASASTVVPDAATFDCSYLRTVEAKGFAYRFYTINNVSCPSSASSIWIAADDLPEPSFFALP